MKLLAIDTSGEACSAALLDGDRVEQDLLQAPRRHAELILAMMQDLLDRAGLRLSDLDTLAFGRGPGSFTGVRIAASVAQGAAFGAGLPVVPVSTLAAMAQGEHRRTGDRRFLAALDARMDEVYWGCYEIGTDNLARACCDECVSRPDEVPVPTTAGWVGVGPGWSAYREVLGERLAGRVERLAPDVACEARDIAVIAAAELAAGRQVPPELAIPVYLRDRVTQAS